MKDKDQVLDSIEKAAGKFDGELRMDYSGRGMFGDKCVGVVVSARKYNDFIAEAGVSGARTDDMGLDMIVYYPRLRTNGNELI